MKVFKCRRQKLVLSKGSVVEVARGDGGSSGAWYAAKIVDVESPRKQSGKSSKIQKVLVEYEQLVSEGESNPLVESVETWYLRPLPPSRESKQCSFKVDDSVEAKWRNGWWPGFVKMVLEDSRYCVCIDGRIVDDVFESSDLREHWGWSKGRWYPTEKKEEQEAPSTLDDQGPLEESCFSKNMPEIGTELELSDVLEDSMKVKAIVSSYPAKNTETQLLSRTLKTPYELRPAKRIKRGALIGNAASRRLLKKLSEGTVKVPSVAADQENDKQKIVEFNDTIKCALRRRGKFAISKAKYMSTHKPAKEDNAGSAIKRVVQTLMQQDGFPRMGCVLGLQAEGRKTFMIADMGQLPNKELGKNEQNCKGKSHKRKRRKPQKLVAVGSEVPEIGGPDASRREGANGSVNFEKKNDLCNAETSNTNEYQPLSTCSDGIHTPTCIECSSESVSGECRCLFVKTSPVWKMIESMEIFQTTPQNPHFSPLWACKEGYREGAAIGITATFASLTDKISNLLFDDPRCRFDSCLETLCDMEKHGFEVTAMQRHVNELVAIKEKQEQLQDGLRDTELEIANKERKGREISEEMEEIDKKMTKLREKYAALKSDKERKEVEITQLRMSLRGNNEQILSVRLEFEKLAALLPWKSK